MRHSRRVVAVACLLALSAQATGAAEIAGMMGPAARAALTPPPGRFAPAPAAAPKPTAPRKASTWSRDAAAVAAWLAQRLDEALAAHRSPAPAARDAVAVPPPEEALPPLEPAPSGRPVDRILIAGGSGVIGAYGEMEAFAAVTRRPLVPYKDRFTGFWSRGDGLSVRVDYLAPWGINRADATGFTMLFPGRAPHRIAATGGVPPVLRREHPIYFAGDAVTVELTLRNDGAAPLRGLFVEAAQEGLMLDGSAGPRLDAGHAAAAPELAPGETATMRWTIMMSRRGTAAVNFEQTAVRVTGGTGEDGKEKVFVDAHQAGIVDPPSP
ncbi:MAG: hypothetical protein SF051_05670 [Elusimicrobiota bacterium]|nr:hypothetical protein [Elusimicrobiota bacterium]